jgi:hypothetical protein
MKRILDAAAEYGGVDWRQRVEIDHRYFGPVF